MYLSFNGEGNNGKPCFSGFTKLKSSTIDPDDEEIVNLVRTMNFDINSDEKDTQEDVQSFNAIPNIGPRCHRCGNPCGNDALFFGQHAYHSKHLTCYRCNTKLKMPIIIENEIYCHSCSLIFQKSNRQNHDQMQTYGNNDDDHHLALENYQGHVSKRLGD